LAVFDRFWRCQGSGFSFCKKGSDPCRRVVRCSAHPGHQRGAAESLAQIKKAMIDKPPRLIRQAPGEGAQIVCLQEIFYDPTSAPSKARAGYDSTEPVPDGPTIHLMQPLAKDWAFRADRPDLRGRNEGVLLQHRGP